MNAPNNGGRFWAWVLQCGASLLLQLVGLVVAVCLVVAFAKNGWPDASKAKGLPNDTNKTVQPFIDWIPERKPGPGDELRGTRDDPWRDPESAVPRYRPPLNRDPVPGMKLPVDSGPQPVPGQFFDSSGRPIVPSKEKQP